MNDTENFLPAMAVAIRNEGREGEALAPDTLAAICRTQGVRVPYAGPDDNDGEAVRVLMAKAFGRSNVLRYDWFQVRRSTRASNDWTPVYIFTARI
jgi:hypothetical protein